MIRVAVVEDNEIVRRTLAKWVDSSPDYQCVSQCTTGKEAVDEIPRCRPDVVLMDIHLPGESGIACTARLRQKAPGVQVIMLTVYKDIKMIFQALKAGACGYVLKRSDEKDVLNAIAEVRAGGAPMTSEIARMVVRSFLEPVPSAADTAQLSPREMEILSQVAEGLSNKEIGARLHISFGTVRTHLMHIYEKLHVRCRTEAAAKYLRSNPAAAVARPAQPL